ncbi:MAG TPA: carboxypeptidase regulatory-like domain-containing protein [Pyrinomonadaceae bacterium]|nr:carboxypeptidase regulatory-like domain-containing protein [Pyrinomonadaceae bacterium]
MKKILYLVAALCLCLTTVGAFAQDRSTTGSIGGVVQDVNGAAVPNATVTVSGATLGTPRTTTTNEEGLYKVDNLIPGLYNVRVELTGFKAANVESVEVNVGRETTISPNLEPGQVSEVVNVTDAAATDLSSTAVGQNLSDTLFDNVPVQRSVEGLFYLAPNTADSLGGGPANPSIAGGSALDNLYIADGVNITDSAFGGLGTFTRVYGSLGTGINTSFIKEVQVKTGGFEPQYGQAQGGIVNIITQSGGNEYHGAIYGFARPNAFEATRRQRDDFSVNKVGEILAEEQYDVGVDVGGYVPGARDKLFFFGSFNPSVRRPIVLGAEGSGLRALLGEHHRRFRTLNYALKVDYNVSPSHTVAFSIFGDPTKTNLSSFNNLNIDNTTAQSVLDYGTRNWSLRYNGALTSTWTLSSTFSHGKNTFDETGFANIHQIVDRTNPVRGNFTAVGLGFFEPTESNTYRWTLDTQKIFNFWGSHTIALGYQYQRAYYEGLRDRSGAKFTVPATNADGLPLEELAGPAAAEAIGQPLNAAFSLRPAAASCTLCPLFTVNGVDIPVFLRQDRGEFGSTGFDTRSNYHAAYIQDAWRINRYVTALIGLRNEQERLIGSPFGANNFRNAYSFTGQWAPRIGVTVDPLGQGRTKAYYNYGRFFEFIPLDLAERSLTHETSFIGGRFAPEFVVVNGVRRAVINQFGTVNPIIDAAHLLNGAAGGTGAGIGISTQDAENPILPGTKLGFTDEHLFGFEQQFPRNFVLTVRYQDRRAKRIVEDAAVISPEQFNAGLFGQTYFIGNINSQTDAAHNPIPHLFTPGGAIPEACGGADAPFVIDPVHDSAGNDIGAVCFEPDPLAGTPGSDGIPDGFPDPVRVYKALTIEVNKRFSNNWQLLSNWTISSLRGNYEGHFRNDNGQTDPAISSLFDFTAGEFNLLGEQFAIGPLNTDRTHLYNIYFNYSFSRESGIARQLAGLNLGVGFHGESGVPISEFFAHPAYLNAGEVPVGGRGKLGRTPWFNRLDLHADYRWSLSENTRLVFISDFFNVTNSTRIARVNEFRESTAGQLNPDFGQPRTFRLPFNMRLGLRFEF